MQSAYNILGIPGNASPEDIESALQRARLFYTPQKMADDSRIAERFTEVMNAYKVLRDPASRAAHDRKLASQGTLAPGQRSAPVRTSRVAESKSLNPLVIIGLLAIAVFAGGFWIQHKRETAKVELAVKEAETARLQAIAEAERFKVEALEKTERARAEAVARQQEQTLRRDSEMAIARAQVAQSRQQSLHAQSLATEQRDAQRKEYERRAEEQRAVADGQRRVAADRQRIRELCYQNYRRPDC